MREAHRVRGTVHFTRIRRYYTQDELNYIWAHRHKPPDEIGKAIGRDRESVMRVLRRRFGVNSRTKGKRGELELSHLLKSYGYLEARRGQQYNGLDGEDVVGMPGYHIEAKRVERLNVYSAIDQSIRDAANDEIPVVFHRKNRRPWLVTMKAEDFLARVLGRKKVSSCGGS